MSRISPLFIIPQATNVQPGTVAIVGAGCGQVDLLTVKAVRTLQMAEVLVYDSLVSHDILALVPRACQLFFVGKRCGQVSSPQEEINALLARLAKQNLRVVRLKGGDPHIFGRGGEEALYLALRGIKSVVVPGITAALGCAASAGIPLTFRGLARSVTLVTGMQCDDAPAQWSALLSAQSTLVFYMGKEQAANIEQSLLTQGVAKTLPIAFVTNGGRQDQQILYGDLGSLASTAASISLQGPSLLIVGEVIEKAQELASLMAQIDAGTQVSSALMEPMAEVAYG